MENSSNEDILIPIFLATGVISEQEAILVIAYGGGSVVRHKKRIHMTLRSALDWNRAEAHGAVGVEKEYREQLVRELEAAIGSGVFRYSEVLISKWAAAFPHYAKKLIDSNSKRIDPALKEIVRNSVRT